MRRICRHCNRCVVTRPKGLCWGCSHKPEVRALYAAGSFNPATARFSSLGLGLGNVNLPLSRKPTRATPGSSEKKDVMRRRARLGLAIFHPLDAKW